jgi:hypothetical protein
MFKVLTICHNTSVETLHHGFPDALQLEHVRESMMQHVAANGQHFEHLM